MVSNEFGKKSEWNEGDLKNLRLHQAQNLINEGKANPLARSLIFGNKFGYELWFVGIDILFGEGDAKYSDTESQEVEKLRDEIEDLMDKNQICTKVVQIGKQGFSVNQVNWKILKPKLRLFEKLVRRYNDEHGLSTRNREEDEGL